MRPAADCEASLECQAGARLGPAAASWGRIWLPCLRKLYINGWNLFDRVSMERRGLEHLYIVSKFRGYMTFSITNRGEGLQQRPSENILWKKKKKPHRRTVVKNVTSKWNHLKVKLCRFSKFRHQTVYSFLGPMSHWRYIGSGLKY